MPRQLQPSNKHIIPMLNSTVAISMVTAEPVSGQNPECRSFLRALRVLVALERVLSGEMMLIMKSR